MDEYIEEEIKEISERLEKLENMSKDNSVMLKYLYRAYRLSYAISIIKWVVIIGFTLGAFYFLQPYLESVMKLYGSVNSLTGGVENNGGIDILKALKNI